MKIVEDGAETERIRQMRITTDAAADSLAKMVIDWVDGGIAGGTDWRPGLANVIKHRLDRLNSIFIHVEPKCEHEFHGWRDHDDGHGGEQYCKKCGIGAMAASLRDGP